MIICFFSFILTLYKNKNVLKYFEDKKDFFCEYIQKNNNNKNKIEYTNIINDDYNYEIECKKSIEKIKEIQIKIINFMKCFFNNNKKYKHTLKKNIIENFEKYSFNFYFCYTDSKIDIRIRKETTKRSKKIFEKTENQNTYFDKQLSFEDIIKLSETTTITIVDYNKLDIAIENDKNNVLNDFKNLKNKSNYDKNGFDTYKLYYKTIFKKMNDTRTYNLFIDH